jgi:hypothetical protein
LEDFLLPRESHERDPNAISFGLRDWYDFDFEMKVTINPINAHKKTIQNKMESTIRDDNQNSG